MVALVVAQDAQGDMYHVARGDISLGEYCTQSFTDTTTCMACVHMLQPTELIVPYEQMRDPFVVSIQQALPELAISHQPLVSKEETYLTSLLHIATTQ